MKTTTKQITYSGLMAALTFISTSILTFPSPFTGGYIHMGDALVLSCGVVLGKKYGALAAGIGSALADLYLGYASWALPTFIIKALMAFIIGSLFEGQGNHKKLVIVSASYIAIWTGFNLIIRNLISANTIGQSTQVLIDDEVISRDSNLLDYALNTQNLLLVIAFSIPIILIIAVLIKHPKSPINLIIHRISGFVMAGSVMVILYYITHGLLYGNWIVPVFSVPLNMVQYILGVILATLLLPLTLKLKNTLDSSHLKNK